MGCIYEDMRNGVCGLCDEDDLSGNPEGSENGVCVCSDDLNPADCCPEYHSDYVCGWCGADLNIEECKCEE